MTNDTDKKIEEAKARIEKKRNRNSLLKLVGVTALGVATLGGPKMALNHEYKKDIEETKEKLSELLELNSQETKQETVYYECLTNTAKEFLEQNGYSFSDPKDMRDGSFKYDIIDKNNEAAGVVSAIHVG